MQLQVLFYYANLEEDHSLEHGQESRTVAKTKDLHLQYTSIVMRKRAA
jgi:hypothetical protein